MENLPFYREGQEEEPLPLFHVNARTVGQPPPPPPSANVEMALAWESAEWTATARSFRLQKKPSPHARDSPFLPTLSTFQLPPTADGCQTPPHPPFLFVWEKEGGGE